MLRVQSQDGYEDVYGSYGVMKPGNAKKATNSTGLASQLVISVALGLFALLLFCFLRTRWIVMFAPRTKLRRHTPPILSATFFGWIPQLLRIPEAEVLDCVGLDAVMLLRFFKMAIKLFMLCSIPGLLIIMPVNYYSARDDPSAPGNGTNVLAALDLDSDALQSTSLLYLFTQFTFAWVFSLASVYTIWHTYEDYITIRRKYMLKRAKSITNRSVMVVGLPTHLQNDRELATFYESLNVGIVESAHVCRHVRTLKRMIQQREHALRNLEEVYTHYYGNPSEFPGYDPDKIEIDDDRVAAEDHIGMDEPEHVSESTSLIRPQAKKRPTMRLGYLGLFGKKVDKIDHYRDIFVTLDKAVQKMRLSRIFPTTSIGFITFEEMHSALGVRSVVVNTTVFFLIFFWSGPIGVFSSFLSLKSLEKLIPGITKIAESNPIFKSVLQGFLPTLGVTVFLAVVPKILQALCERQGIQSRSGVARSLYNKYFTFILFNVVLVFTVVGTWAQLVNKVYHNIGELTLLLAASLPRVAPFFVNYLILKGIGLFPLQLLQIGEVIDQVVHGILSKTPRDYAEARAPPELHHGVVYANATLAMVIVLIYSCLKPLILVFGVIYFSLGYLVFKYQLLYVLFHPYESSGQTWPMAYNRITLGLIIFQLTTLGLFMLRQAYILGILLVPLPIGTIWFWAYTTRQYKESAEFIPLELLRPEEIEAHQEPHENSAVLPTAVGSATQLPGHVLIDVDQNDGAAGTTGNTKMNGSAVVTATAVVTPGGTFRRIPKSVVEEDDYQAIPDRYTDYRQPPMTLYPGVLNSSMRQYNHPAIAGPLPTLWLPLRKGDGGKQRATSQEPRVAPHGSETDSDSDDEHHAHEHVEDALARPPLMLPTKDNDMPQSYDEGDNLVGGGQDEDFSSPAGGLENTATITDAGISSSPNQSRGPQGILTFPEAESPMTTQSADGATDATASGVESKRNSAVEGVKDVYYHHPERRASRASTGSSANLMRRSLQGEGSRGNLQQDEASAPAGLPTSAAPPAK
ncbi:hypothetical protein BGZ99_006549 [Dissophora globulifera]|uniref:DUF221-domain-containing protein n=1 Tax=Dissophora globulifera TaxID=979702 RepID=A0A9P6REP7_9FUNG|nr:hypothetical protein BGZ99_006549 [Dissophora globulifera]